MAETKYQQETWSLDELFTALDAPEVQTAKEDIEKRVGVLEAYRDKLSADMDSNEFLAFLKSYEELARLISQYSYYGELKFAEDTQDQNAQTYQAQARQLAAEVDNRTLFFKLWWKSLEDDEAEKLMSEVDEFKYWLEALRLQKPYTLSEPEEQVINLKNVNGINALVTLYETITSRYTFNLEIDGEMQELTEGELRVHFRDPDPDIREATFKELGRVYGNDATALGLIYQSLVRDWRSENVDMRGYASPMSVRNLRNHIPDDVVSMLLEVTRKNISIFQRFHLLKAKWLGVDKLRRYDIYAPVVKSQKTYEFQESVDMVLNSFEAFEPKVSTLARRVFDEKHIDSEVRKGKLGGAFCATVTPDLTPWVLQSFQGKADDVATLAHELGHAIHSMLASHHNVLTQHSSLPLAETASTFGEMLLIDHLLKQDPDPEVRRDLLFRQMDDNYATIVLQAYFAIFERDAHKVIMEGGSIEDVSDVYFRLLEEQHGDSMIVTQDFRGYWLGIPHFYRTPFYVYAYAFGQILVLSLYKRFREEGDSFKPGYLDILAAGGSDAPARILERAGIDIRNEGFWQGGFDVIDQSLKDLEALKIPE
jgi:oligoendopeptidase F